MVIDTWGPEETRAFGKKMGQEARPGQVICLMVTWEWERLYLLRDLQRDLGLMNR